MKDVYPAGSSSRGLFTKVNGTLFFGAFDGTHGLELWKSDGTEAGTVLVKDISAGSVSSDVDVLREINGILFFSADDGTHGREIWRSDGAKEGTIQVQEIAPGPESSSPSAFIPVGNRVFFAADDRVNGSEPWAGRAAILMHQPARAVQDLKDEVTSLRLA